MHRRKYTIYTIDNRKILTKFVQRLTKHALLIERIELEQANGREIIVIRNLKAQYAK